MLVSCYAHWEESSDAYPEESCDAYSEKSRDAFLLGGE